MVLINLLASPSMKLINPIYFRSQSITNLISNSIQLKKNPQMLELKGTRKRLIIPEYSNQERSLMTRTVGNFVGVTSCKKK